MNARFNSIGWFASLMAMLMAAAPVHGAMAPFSTIPAPETVAAQTAASGTRPVSVKALAQELDDPLAAAGLTPGIVALPGRHAHPKVDSLSLGQVLQGLGMLFVVGGSGLGLLRWHQGQMRKRAWLQAVKAAACPAPIGARSR
jgi:hypothetical protein